MIEWIQNLSKSDALAIAVEVFLAARAFQALVLPHLKSIAEKTQANWDNTAVAWLGDVLAWMAVVSDYLTRIPALVIPDKPPEKPEMFLGESLGQRPMLSDVARRNAIAVVVRRLARRAGYNLDNLSPTEFTTLVDYVEDESQKAPRFPGLRDMLDWMLRNPDKVIAIVKTFMLVFTEENEPHG